MRVLPFLILSMMTATGFGQDSRCQDLLVRHQIKPYFSLFFQAAGGEFITDGELARSEEGAAGSSQEWDSDFEELIPFEDPQINAIAHRMRAILQNPEFRKYAEHGRWNEFEKRFLSPKSRFHMELGDLIWATFTLSALQGDLSLASKWISDRLPLGWLDENSTIATAERKLVNYGLSDRMRVYQAVYEVFSVTIALESKARAGLDAKLINWSFLRDNLSATELFLAKQVFSWAPGQDFRRDQMPGNFQASVDHLFYELAMGRASDDTISNVQTFLSYAVSDEDLLAHSLSITLWPVALDWLKRHKEDGTRLVRDAVEFRKFFPEIR